MPLFPIFETSFTFFTPPYFANYRRGKGYKTQKISTLYNLLTPKSKNLLLKCKIESK